MPVFSRSGSIETIQSTTVWSVHCSSGGNGLHDGSQGNQTDGSKQGYKNPTSTETICWPEPHHTKLVSSIVEPWSEIRLGSNHGEVRTGTQADLRFHRLPVLPQRGQGQTQLGMLAEN